MCAKGPGKPTSLCGDTRNGVIGRQKSVVGLLRSLELAIAGAEANIGD